jgi:hypothetical protein
MCCILILKNPSFFFKQNYNEEFREILLLKHNKPIANFGVITPLISQSSVTEAKKGRSDLDVQ